MSIEIVNVVAEDVGDVNDIGRYISWEPMLSIRAAKAGCRVGEIPGDELPRIGAKRPGWLLPESRIHHVKSGAAMAWLVAEEVARR